MDKFGRWSKNITFAYLILIFISLLAYGCFVKGGSWGSFSDVVIAIFTILISYSTTLLLIAAYLTASSWIHEKRYDFSWELIKKLSELYFLMHSKKSTRNKIEALKGLESTRRQDKANVIPEVQGLLSNLGLNIDWSSDQFTDAELIIYKKQLSAYRNQLINKSRAIYQKQESLKFEVLAAANILNNELVDGGIDIMKEVTKLINLQENYHKFGSELFSNVSKALGLKEHRIVLIGEPASEYPPLKNESADGK